MRIFAFGLLLGLSFSTHAFGTFDGETAKLRTQIGCKAPKLSGAAAGMGRLWGCIGGSQETVKMFVNEEAGGKVRNVKFMWNDYFKNVGSGVHPDKDLANAWAAALATMYAPTQVEKVLQAFRGTAGTRIAEGPFVLTYTYERGPAIDERMIVVTRK